MVQLFLCFFLPHDPDLQHERKPESNPYDAIRALFAPGSPSCNICMGFHATTSNAVRTNTCCNVTNLIEKHDRSDQLTTTAPTPTVTAFKYLLPTDTQEAPHCMMPEIDAPIQDLWDLDLDPLGPLAPIDIAADWNTAPGLVFPSMDPLSTRTSNEGREVNVP